MDRKVAIHVDIGEGIDMSAYMYVCASCFESLPYAVVFSSHVLSNLSRAKRLAVASLNGQRFLIIAFWRWSAQFMSYVTSVPSRVRYSLSFLCRPFVPVNALLNIFLLSVCWREIQRRRKRMSEYKFLLCWENKRGISMWSFSLFLLRGFTWLYGLHKGTITAGLGRPITASFAPCFPSLKMVLGKAVSCPLCFPPLKMVTRKSRVFPSMFSSPEDGLRKNRVFTSVFSPLKVVWGKVRSFSPCFPPLKMVLGKAVSFPARQAAEGTVLSRGTAKEAPS